jgi:CHAT domain-containing protein/tetratricopeptide (TPR) repeat protein
MGRLRCRSLLLGVALLAPIRALAAPPADQAAYREIERLCDRYEWSAAEAKIDEAQRRFANKDSQWIWGFSIERAITLIAARKVPQARAILDAPPPPKFANTEPAVKGAIWRGLLLGRERITGADAFSAMAYAQAKARFPRLQSEAALACANVAFYQNDPAAQLRWARDSLRHAHAHGQHLREILARITLATGLGKQEHFDEAIAINERALPEARAAKVDAFVAKVAVSLAWQYLALGQYDRAEDAAAEGYAASVRAGVSHDVTLSLILRGNSHYYRSNFILASQWYRQAYAIARNSGDSQTGIIAANLAAVALDSRDFASARRYNDEALLWKRRTHDSEAELHSLLLDGRIAFGMQQFAEAETPLKRVIAETTSKALRWEAQTRLAQVYAATRRNALADAEFQRALDAAAEARADVSDEELRMTFADTVLDFYDAYVEFLVAAGRPLDALRVTERSRASTLAEGLGFDVDRAAALDPQQLARNRGAVILSYWLAPERSFLWVITPEDSRMFPLPSGVSIAADAESYSRELFGPRSTISERGAKLWRTLVGPAAALLPERGGRVVIIPDGRLNALNFETLVAGPRPHYWIEDVTLETASSLQLAAGASRSRSNGDRLLLVGDPRVPASTEFPPLPHAASEMERVRKHFPVTKELGGNAATPEAYETSAGGDYAFVHFVAHGTANLKRPLDSAVILSPDANGYKLYARDIIKHPLTARLVTISSCYGAGTRTYAGEGLVGLAWAFLRAGAHEVIAALWQVNDRATPQLMDRMYEGIRAGQDPASALRAAKLQLMRSSPIYKRPLYWAPFVLYSGS